MGRNGLFQIVDCERSVYDKELPGRTGFADCDLIAILTLVACAQLLTWPGLRLKLQTQTQLKPKQRPWMFPRPDSSVVERGPEKAGVGGSIPSLATTF
jgi:hypothetical protein